VIKENEHGHLRG